MPESFTTDLLVKQGLAVFVTVVLLGATLYAGWWVLTKTLPAMMSDQAKADQQLRTDLIATINSQRTDFMKLAEMIQAQGEKEASGWREQAKLLIGHCGGKEKEGG